MTDIGHHERVMDYYNSNAKELSEAYNSYDRAAIHKELMDVLPSGRLSVLDVGSGSGADANMFAGRGYDVIAVEPADALRACAKKSFQNNRIIHVFDTLPDLAGIRMLRSRFNVVVARDVLQHLDKEGRPNALNSLFNMINSGGFADIQYPVSPSGPHQFPVPDEEVLAALKGRPDMRLVKSLKTMDPRGRKGADGVSDLCFRTLILRRA